MQGITVADPSNAASGGYSFLELAAGATGRKKLVVAAQAAPGLYGATFPAGLGQLQAFSYYGGGSWWIECWPRDAEGNYDATRSVLLDRILVSVASVDPVEEANIIIDGRQSDNVTLAAPEIIIPLTSGGPAPLSLGLQFPPGVIVRVRVEADGATRGLVVWSTGTMNEND